MGYMIWLYLVLALSSVSSKLRNRACTFSCRCYNTTSTVKVKCTSGYWKKIPDVPQQTTNLVVSKSNFGVLQGPSVCQNYDALTRLDLNDCNITAIRKDAFRCVTGLLILNIRLSHLKTVDHTAFLPISKLRYLKLTKGDLPRDIIRTLCTLYALTDLRLTWNNINITPGSLDCMKNLTHLTLIDISGNNLIGSVKRILEPLRNVSMILAQSCNIAHLEEDSFLGFRASTINLKSNHIHDISKYVLNNMSKLQSLLLDSNPLQGIDDWIKELNELKELHIAATRLSHVPLLPKAINILSIGSNNLRRLSKYTFYNYTSLQSLLITNAGIHEVENKSFYMLPKLRDLNLQSNNLTASQLSNILWAILSLERLTLSTNPIGNLNNMTFWNFKPHNLVNLRLEHCSIEEIETGSFGNFASLEGLYLSWNKLYKLHKDAFVGLHSLNTLSMKNNMLTTFNCELVGMRGSPLITLNLFGNHIERKAMKFNCLVLLKKLYLGRNDITTLHEDTFKNMSSLEVLVMKKTNLNNILHGAFSNLVNIRNLVLEDNRVNLLQLLEADFHAMKYLDVLELSDTLIGNANPNQLIDIWKNAHNLQTLKLKSCRISSLVPGMFSSLWHLKEISLGINFISFIEPFAFKNATKLEELYLHKNRITSVNWESFMFLPNLRILSLAGNPLLCTCESLWVIQTIQSQELYLQDSSAVRCQPPGHYKTRPLNVKLTDCEEPWVLLLKPIALFLTGVCAIFMMFLLWHYRWHIKYTIFLAKAGRHRYQDMHDDTQYRYDAFVAYSSKDLSWVTEMLLPNVDAEFFGPDGFQLCVHDRDWLGGEVISENIRKSIVESRRTIVVLSPAFASSHWCKLELAMAHMRLDAEGRGKNRLIIILLSDIPTSLLNAHLIHILTTKTYISWPNDPALQPHFWKAIRRSLKKELLYF